MDAIVPPVERRVPPGGKVQPSAGPFVPMNRNEGPTMSPQTPECVVPYHVQTTASALRDGFPWFAHHESVSALWAKKWRAPCSAGIYPSTDGAVEDFDPVFAELIRLSGDDPAFLHRPDDYAKPFMLMAKHLASCAEEALGAGRRDEAKNLYLCAAAVYRIARFPINRSRLGQEGWNKGKAAYEAGGRLIDPPNLEVAIPFTAANTAAGDLQDTIEAYLRVTSGAAPVNGWPVLLFICGLDTYKTDNTRRLDKHLRRGVATISFEIPGTGDCPAAPSDPASPDRLMSSVLDWVRTNAPQYGFDTGHILARGISTGGYYAFRVAHTHAPALFAVVAEGSGCHHMFDPAWIAAQNQMEYPFALADALVYKFGYRDADPAAAIRRYAAEARKFSLLDAGILDQPSCRLLAINGMEDSIFPIEDNFIVAARGTGKDLIARGNRGHMGNPGAEEIIYDWIDQALAAGSGERS